ncbi:MAG: 4-hydroxy-tetrahydrodipicolinate reductase [Woeseiaceae bacterium]|nr:4-hydroxy-tetrahydrodipicolinate reductase [Woeseiaceae bacterium]
MPLRIAIAGAGRMGQAIARLAAGRDDVTVAGMWRRGDDLAALLDAADVVIDFSLPEGTAEVLDGVRAAAKPLVCGVSGLDERQLAALDAAAGEVAVVYDRNMSRGIAVLDAAVRQVAGALGEDFRVSIDEVHHVHKKDAPSGTALKLGEAVAAARGTSADTVEYHSERRGEVPGDHSVHFRAATETLTLSHSVTTRDVFAEGALTAAAWVVAQPPGRYSMRDVLFGRR